MTAKQLGTLSLIFILYFAGVIISLHFLRPDVDPVDRPTSEYAIGRYRHLMSSAFASMCLATFFLLAGLHKTIAKPVQSRLGMILFAYWGIAVLVAMSFPINPEGTELTPTAMVHRINGPIAFASLTISIFLLTRSFRRDENWRSFYPTAKILSWIIAAMFLITGASVKFDFEGLCQRIFLVFMITWFILTIRYVRMISKG
ncbi:MAG TPA: DUF998 domain-containing protein [Chitinophagaceae bacterium]|nr:DUF998 domain-containing protein [Chitinophagaceae bacterium]